MKGFKYVLGKNDGRKGLHIYAARMGRQEGRKFTYVRGKMYAARRTEERIYI